MRCDEGESFVGFTEALCESGTGFDLGSGGELRRVLAAGADVKSRVLAGAGTSESESESEIELAMPRELFAFQEDVESESQSARID